MEGLKSEYVDAFGGYYDDYWWLSMNNVNYVHLLWVLLQCADRSIGVIVVVWNVSYNIDNINSKY